MARKPLVIGSGNVRAELTSADALEVPGAIELPGVEVVTLSSNASDYALPSTASALLIDCDTAAVEISGMQGGAQGREVVIALRQTSAHSLTLKARTGPTGANWFATDVDTVLAPGEGSTWRWMDPGSPGNPGWRLVGLGKVPGSLAGYATEAYADSAAAGALAAALAADPTTIDVPITFGAGSVNGAPLPLGNSEAKGIAQFSYTLTGWRLWVYPAVSSGTFELDIRAAATGAWPPYSGDSIVGGTGPNISTGVEEDGDTSAWASDTLTAGDAVECVVVTNTAGVRKYVLALEATRPL